MDSSLILLSEKRQVEDSTLKTSSFSEKEEKEGKSNSSRWRGRMGMKTKKNCPEKTEWQGRRWRWHLCLCFWLRWWWKLFFSSSFNWEYDDDSHRTSSVHEMPLTGEISCLLSYSLCHHFNVHDFFLSVLTVTPPSQWLWWWWRSLRNLVSVYQFPRHFNSFSTSCPSRHVFSDKNDEVFLMSLCFLPFLGNKNLFDNLCTCFTCLEATRLLQTCFGSKETYFLW